ncbi:11864_t:CDS:2, partial [Racocetra persica]
NDSRLEEEHKIVEIDKSKFKKDISWWVVGLTKKKSNKYYFEVVQDRNTNTLTKIIKNMLFQKQKSIQIVGPNKYEDEIKRLNSVVKDYETRILSLEKR